MDWDYDGERGPEHWKQLCPAFFEAEEGSLQSPIMLSEKTATKADQQKKARFFYETTRFSTSFYNHTVHLAPLEKEKQNKVLFDDTPFFLDDIHVHLPSEHQIDEHTFAMEIHFVHRSAQQEILVVAVMAEKSMQEKSNQTFSLDHIKDQTQCTLVLPDWMPQSSSFFYYSGSLTTPPTKGPVNWLVFIEPISLDASLLNDMQQQLGKTNRPLQPIQDRSVHLYSDTE